MNKFLEKSKQYGIFILRIVIAVGTILLLIWLMRTGGLKGILGFFLGMALMAYLLLSKNILILFLVEFLGGDFENTNAGELRKK